MGIKLATLCYLRQDGQTLMIHRVKREGDIHQGKWNGLGGKFEPGESPEECVIREVQEEAGLQIFNPILKGFLSFPAFANDEDWYAFVFVADEFDGLLLDPPEGFLKWIPDNELLSLNLWEGDHFFLPLLDQPGFFSAKFVYHDGKLIDYEIRVYRESPSIPNT
jgi:8-oxo-dGTP diphosphatase